MVENVSIPIAFSHQTEADPLQRRTTKLRQNGSSQKKTLNRVGTPRPIIVFTSFPLLAPSNSGLSSRAGRKRSDGGNRKWMFVQCIHSKGQTGCRRSEPENKWILHHTYMTFHLIVYICAEANKFDRTRQTPFSPSLERVFFPPLLVTKASFLCSN